MFRDCLIKGGLSLSVLVIPTLSFVILRGGSSGGRAPGARPSPPKIGKNMIFLR
jgi:hypothetical protein